MKESQQHDPSQQPNHQRGRRISRVAMVTAPLLLAAACATPAHKSDATAHRTTTEPTETSTTSRSTSTTEKPTTTTTARHESTTSTTVQMTKRDLQPPLKPVGGEYELASNAAYALNDGNTISDAEKDVAGIADPSLKAQAQHAVDEAIAADAALKADNDVSSPQDAAALYSEVGQIVSPGVRASASKAVDTGVAAEAALYATQDDYNSARALEPQITDPSLVNQVEKVITEEQKGNIDNASSAWDSINTSAINEWDTLNNQALAEGDTLYRHTNEYVTYYDSLPE